MILARIARSAAAGTLWALIGLHGGTAAASATAEEHIPGASLFQLPIMLETADRGTLSLKELRGRPLLVTMFYSQCTSVCPLLTARLQALVDGLAPAEQRALTILMISLDSERDTPEALREFKVRHGIQNPNWIVARVSARDVRLLAAALGIRYRELPDHSFNHAALVSLADGDGTVIARAGDLIADEAAFSHAIHQLLTVSAKATLPDRASPQRR